MDFLNRNSNLGIALLIVLVLVILLIILIFVSKKRESFLPTSWGFVPESPAPFINDSSNRNIVGPDPNSNTITGWQYNPQNTLVD